MAVPAVFFTSYHRHTHSYSLSNRNFYVVAVVILAPKEKRQRKKMLSNRGDIRNFANGTNFKEELFKQA